jgi:hypothetical protein
VSCGRRSPLEGRWRPERPAAPDHDPMKSDQGLDIVSSMILSENRFPPVESKSDGMLLGIVL